MAGPSEGLRRPRRVPERGGGGPQAPDVSGAQEEGPAAAAAVAAAADEAQAAAAAAGGRPQQGVSIIEWGSHHLFLIRKTFFDWFLSGLT